MTSYYGFLKIIIRFLILRNYFTLFNNLIYNQSLFSSNAQNIEINLIQNLKLLNINFTDSIIFETSQNSY